jgi:mannan endo-1,4-beta-mannosidase
MHCHCLLRFLPPFLAVLVLAAYPTAVPAANTGTVSVEGDKFMLNGVPFYYAGTNNYYQMVYAADLGLRPYVEEVQTETAGLGLTVLRTWAFNDGASQWNALQTSPGVYEESVFQGLDYVLHLADQNGLRLILPFVNNWDDYGGMNQYVAWSGTASAHDDFYTDANCRTWYKNHVSTVLNRVNTFNGRIYREDPTIFAWELANEPECPSDLTGATLEAWIVEMSAYIKSIDATHLVTTGSQGYYGPAGPAHNPRSWMYNRGCDFIPHHAVATIDFACVHDWGAHWGTSYAESMTWVRDHIDDSTDLLGKPVILEEFGEPRPIETRDVYYQGWYDEIYLAAQAGEAAGGSNFWILYHDDYEDYDGFGVYYPEDTSTCAIIAAEAARMNALIVPNTSSTHTIQIASVSPGAERVVSIGSWYELSDSAGWTFRPETDIDHVELALYGSDTELAAGTTPFEQHQTRTSALGPDGPENELGELGYEVSPNVLGDNNQHLYGKPHYKSIRLYGGQLSPDSAYQVSFADSAPSRIWLHPLRSSYFTMSADILQSSESTLTNPIYGPASVTRTILSADLTRFEYTGLSPDIATGLKDDYPVGDYDQRPGSHGNGDFGWFPGYSLSFHNEGPSSVAVALFVNTGFTGPSGAPTNTLANDTFWKSEEMFISVGDTATVKLDFDSVQGYSLSDNPFPHTAGDQSAPDGTAGVADGCFGYDGTDGHGCRNREPDTG